MKMKAHARILVLLLALAMLLSACGLSLIHI